MDLGWNESALRVDPKYDPSGTKVKHMWNFSEIKVEIRWGYKCKQYFLTKIVVGN
jgi:hypothetical protein